MRESSGDVPLGDSAGAEAAGGEDAAPYVHSPALAETAVRLVDQAYGAAPRWWGGVTGKVRSAAGDLGLEPQTPLVRELIFAAGYVLRLGPGGQAGCELRPSLMEASRSMQDSPRPQEPMGQAPLAPGRKGSSATRRPASADRPIHIFLAFCCLPIALIGLILSAKSYAHATLSSYTQTHGIRENALVDAVSITCPGGSKSSRCSRYTQLTVTLPRPVRGHTASIVNVHQDPHRAKGDTITVLVDPQAPSYSELPGKPFYPLWESEVALAASVALIVLAISIFLAPQWRKRGHRRLKPRDG